MLMGPGPSYPYVKTSLIILPIILCNCRLSVTLEEQELLTLSGYLRSHPGVSGVRVLIDQFLVFCVVFCRSLFILLPPSFWPLYYMSFDLWPLVSSFHIYYMWSHQRSILTRY